MIVSFAALDFKLARALAEELAETTVILAVGPLGAAAAAAIAAAIWGDALE